MILAIVCMTGSPLLIICCPHPCQSAMKKALSDHDKERPMTNIYDIPLKRIDGTPVTLEAFKGKVLLVVNVASKCGLTPQYESLEALYREKSGEGLEILGFPANNF